MQLLKIITFTFCFLAISWANASLITEDDYIVFEHEEVTLNWAWASNFNVQFYMAFGTPTNEFFAPETQTGWRLATNTEMGYFLRDISSSNFLDLDTGKYTTAISVFNDSPSEGFSVSDFDQGDISFGYQSGVTIDQFGSYHESAVFDTFYVSDALPGPQPIPEPWSILIFVTGLLALQNKLRKKLV